MSKPWFLYMIECVDGSIYTGIAVDVAGRYAAHCAGTGALKASEAAAYLGNVATTGGNTDS